jgi:hypothetical protein
LTFAEIIEISGVKVNWKETSTNLMLPELPYQSARLNFEIVRLSKPDQPFANKELDIKKALVHKSKNRCNPSIGY